MFFRTVFWVFLLIFSSNVFAQTAPTNEQLAAQIKVLQKRYASAEARISELENRVGELEKRVDATEQSLDWFVTHESELWLLQSQVSSLQVDSYMYNSWLQDHQLTLALHSNELTSQWYIVNAIDEWADPLMPRISFKVDSVTGVAGIVITANALKVTAESTFDGVVNWIEHNASQKIVHDMSATFQCLDDAYLSGQLCIVPE